MSDHIRRRKYARGLYGTEENTENMTRPNHTARSRPIRHRRRNRRVQRRRNRRYAAVLRRIPGMIVRVLMVIALCLIAFRIAERFLFKAPEIPDPAEPLAYLPEQGPALDHNDDPDLSDGVPEVNPASAPRRDGFYTFLLAGVDDGNGGSDTIIVLALDTVGKSAYGVSIPRDTKAIVNGRARKMNAAYKSGGMDLLSDTIARQLGIPIDYTMEIDLSGFAAVIDAIGGVDFDVPIDMDYDDPAQDLAIHIPAGFQHLDGETALKVVRFRHNNDGSGYGNEDLGRIATQQKFLKAAAKKLISPLNLMKINEFSRIFQRSVKTDLSLSNLAWLAEKIFSVGADNISFVTLQGTWKSPYIYPDPDDTLILVNGHLNPYQEPLRPEDLHLPS